MASFIAFATLIFTTVLAGLYSLPVADCAPSELSGGEIVISGRKVDTFKPSNVFRKDLKQES